MNVVENKTLQCFQLFALHFLK